MEAKLLVVFAGREKARSHENAGSVELGPPAMAEMAAFSRCRARARRGSGRGSVERVLGALHISSERGHAEGTRQDEEAQALHGCPRVLPLTHFAEQLAGDVVASVGRVFGLLPGRYGHWAKNKNCSTQPTLQFSFNGHGY